MVYSSSQGGQTIIQSLTIFKHNKVDKRTHGDFAFYAYLKFEKTQQLFLARKNEKLLCFKQ